MRRYGAQRDRNEPELVQTAQALGWSVFPLSAPGWPDLVCVRRGVVRFLEVKTKDGELEPAQVKLHQRLAAAGLVVHIVRTVTDVLGALGARP